MLFFRQLLICLLLIIELAYPQLFGHMTWENVKNFFDLSTIPEEKKIAFENNLKLLIEKQLKLPSGEKMWAAFLYLQKQCEGNFNFVFQFELLDISAASILLKEYDKINKKLIFQITCNKIFSNNIPSSEEFDHVNILCRPCLIKLNEEYHLRE